MLDVVTHYHAKKRRHGIANSADFTLRLKVYQNSMYIAQVHVATTITGVPD
jgi:hypothetical protein